MSVRQRSEGPKVGGGEKGGGRKSVEEIAIEESIAGERAKSDEYVTREDEQRDG
jgi:hypothetical protein